MALIIPEGYAQVTLVWTGSYFESGGGATSFGFGELLGPDPTPLEDVAEEVAIAANATIMDRMSNLITLSEVRVAGAVEGASVTVGTIGTNNWQVPPSNTAVLYSYNTARRGRRGRGRNFWPGMAQESEIDNLGLLNTDAVTRIAGGLSEFFETVETEIGSPQVILQHTTPTGPDAPDNPTPPITPPPVVTSRVLQPKVATQRRRLRR